jgi:hypothetical protein
MNKLDAIKHDLPEMRSQLIDCFPDQQDVIAEAADKVIVWGIARHFEGGWDTGDYMIPARDLYALAPLVDQPTRTEQPKVGGPHGYPAQDTAFIAEDGTVFAWESGAMGSGMPGYWRGVALAPQYD